VVDRHRIAWLADRDESPEGNPSDDAVVGRGSPVYICDATERMFCLVVL